MRWIVIATAALLAAALVLRFNRAAAALIVAGVAAVGAFAWHQQSEADRRLSLIPPEQVQLQDLRLTNPDRSSRELRGRLRNASLAYTITELGLEITVDLCSDGACRPVDRARVILPGPIPPQAERPIHQRVLFTSLVSPEAHYVPHFRLLYVKAR